MGRNEKTAPAFVWRQAGIRKSLFVRGDFWRYHAPLCGHALGLSLKRRPLLSVLRGETKMHPYGTGKPPFTMLSSKESGKKVTFCFHKNSGKKSGRRGRRFDEQFAPKKKEFRPSQEEFYIHSHSVIR